MRLVLLTSVSCLWAGASALSFERAKSLSDESGKEGSLLRGRSLNTFLDPLDFDIEGLAGNGVEGGYPKCKYGKGKGGSGKGGSKTSKGGATPSGKGKGGGGKGGSKGGSGSMPIRNLPEEHLPPSSYDNGNGKGSKGSKGYYSKGTKSKGTKSKGTKSEGYYSKGTKSGGKGYYPEYCICENNGHCYVDRDEECCHGKCVKKGTCTAEPEQPEVSIPVLPPAEVAIPPATDAPVQPEVSIPAVPCPDCGELNERCCLPEDENIGGDSKCFEGLICNSTDPVDGICVPCGELDLPCCESNAGSDDLCGDNLKCRPSDNGSKTCVESEECPTCPTCPNFPILPELPETCVPNGEKECTMVENCCDSDACDESSICCKAQFQNCTFEGSSRDFLDDQCCDDIDRVDGKRTCQLLGEIDAARCCGLRGEATCGLDDECCGDLLCGIETEKVDGTLPDDFDPDQCCVPSWMKLYEKYNGFISGDEPKCRSGFKPLNVVLGSSTYDIDSWNECCDPNDYCDPNGNCVPCLPPGGIGCTSNPNACCGGARDDGAVADCAKNKVEPTERQGRPSNQCCIRNGSTGCKVTGIKSFDDQVCCQNSLYEFECVDNDCCLVEGKPCVGDNQTFADNNCCGNLVCLDYNGMTGTGMCGPAA